MQSQEVLLAGLVTGAVSLVFAFLCIYMYCQFHRQRASSPSHWSDEPVEQTSSCISRRSLKAFAAHISTHNTTISHQNPSLPVVDSISREDNTYNSTHYDFNPVCYPPCPSVLTFPLPAGVHFADGSNLTVGDKALSLASTRKSKVARYAAAIPGIEDLPRMPSANALISHCISATELSEEGSSPLDRSWMPSTLPSITLRQAQGNKLTTHSYAAWMTNLPKPMWRPRGNISVYEIARGKIKLWDSVGHENKTRSSTAPSYTLSTKLDARTCLDQKFVPNSFAVITALSHKSQDGLGVGLPNPLASPLNGHEDNLCRQGAKTPIFNLFVPQGEGGGSERVETHENIARQLHTIVHPADTIIPPSKHSSLRSDDRPVIYSGQWALPRILLSPPVETAPNNTYLEARNHIETEPRKAQSEIVSSRAFDAASLDFNLGFDALFQGSRSTNTR